MRRPRPSGSLLLSITVHVVLAFVLLNAAFQYNYSKFDDGPRPPVPAQEHLVYVGVAPPAGAAQATDSATAPAKATGPTRTLAAPQSVPDGIPLPAPSTSGTQGGVEGGRGAGGGVGVTTGIVPSAPDPRLALDPHVFYPLPKTHAERVDSALKASIYAYNDSVARAMARAGKQPGDWTFEKNGQKWGVDGSKIYLGKFAIPSAVLAALPIRVQGNPGEAATDRLSTARRADIALHAQSQYHDAEFKSAVKRIRERKDRERREKQQNPNVEKPVATTP